MPVQRAAAPSPHHWTFDTALYTAPVLATVAEVGLTLTGRVARPWTTAAASGLMAATAAVVNLRRGQPAWCACNTLRPGTIPVTDQHTSQHWLDPYALSHMLHGVLTYGAAALLPARVGLASRALATCAAAVGWELFENSPYVIERYRKTTIAQGYEGDSVANSMADVAVCMAGFLIASSVPVSASVALFLGVEIGMAATVRDNLTLSTIMLIHPVKAIRDWQERRPKWA